MINMFDASTPPMAAPSGFKVVAGYIGGDTPHVWSNQEWARFKGFYKLPIYVRSFSGVPGEDDAFAALKRLYELAVPLGSRVALDIETMVMPKYVTAFNDVMDFYGYRTWVYGSASTVFSNPVCHGYWVADYAGKGPFNYPHAGVVATQWTDGPDYDSSLTTSYRRERYWL